MLMIRIYTNKPKEKTMKKAAIMITSLVLACTVFTGCSSGAVTSKTDSSGQNSAAASSTENKKLKVYTSFYAMYDFAKKVGGDKADIVNLVPAGTEPHDWEPATTDLINLEKADVLVYNGASMESWIDKVTGSLQNKRLISVEASKGLTLMAGHAEEGEKATQYDPHTWLNPENAKKEMETISCK